MEPLRPVRSGEAGGRDSPGRAGGEQREIAWPTWARELADHPSWFPPPPKPHPGRMGPGGIGSRARGEQERQVGGAIWEERQRSRGLLPHPLRPREPAELPGRSPALQAHPPPSALVLGA